MKCSDTFGVMTCWVGFFWVPELFEWKHVENAEVERKNCRYLKAMCIATLTKILQSQQCDAS
jgi:hypothetical protein